jgi:hypothetical protein
VLPQGRPCSTLLVDPGSPTPLHPLIPCPPAALSRVQVLLPYLGAETVCKDAHSLKLLITVLKGNFERLTVGDLVQAHPTKSRYIADGLFVVPDDGASRGRTTLDPREELLQVADGGCSGNVCYLLASEVRTALHLTGSRSHIYSLLCAHASHEHADRHFATHIATVHRKEEGFILVNAHPAYGDAIAITGMVNEPPAREGSNLKMVQGYARLLPDGDPLLVERGLKQPKGAQALWNESILPPEGRLAPEGWSERMVMYVTTRKSYAHGSELTVDYGRSYARDYASGVHKPAIKKLNYSIPRDAITPAQRAKLSWPDMPGWFNPKQQPPRRPAFAIGPAGKVTVCADDPSVVRARKTALGETCGAAASKKDARLPPLAPPSPLPMEADSTPSTPKAKAAVTTTPRLPHEKTVAGRKRTRATTEAPTKPSKARGVLSFVAKRAR